MTRTGLLIRIAVSLALLVGSAFYLVEAAEFEPLAAYVPLLAGSASAVLLTLVLLRDIVRLSRLGPGDSVEESQTIEGGADIAISRTMVLASAKYIAVILLLFLAVLQVGLLVAGPVFAAVFLFADSRLRWTSAALVGVCVFAVFFLLNRYLAFQLP